MNDNKRKTASTFILILTSFIWGAGFISQSIGADFVGPFTFLALRSWIAAAALIPVVWILVVRKSPLGLKGLLNRNNVKGGLLCGLFLFLASAVQQMGIPYTTTAKAGFLTAMYVVMVPVICLVANWVTGLWSTNPGPFGTENSGWRVWIGVMLTVIGLFLLCLKGRTRFEKGDLLIILCALLYAFQIMAINRYVKTVEPVLLAWMEFFWTALFATVFMLIFEDSSVSGLTSAAPSIIFAGFFSSACGYTLQIVGQKGLHPTIASIIMSLESVFSAILGWIILGQRLSFREICGCALIFAAIIVSQTGKQAEMTKETGTEK